MSQIMNPVHAHNRRVWDERARQRMPHTEPASDQDFQNPMAVIDECGWLGGNVSGRRVLCLAAGGGRHSVLFAAAGAEVTVVDISAEMLALDRTLAAERQLKIKIVEASMDDLSMLPTAHFELVIQPVSTCYVPDILAVYREVARLSAADGLYISQHKQPASLQASVAPAAKGYWLNDPYYRTEALPPVSGSLHRESGTLEFIHRWEELLGGLCRSGFVIEDLLEPRHADLHAEPGTFAHRSSYVPPYVTVKARRRRDPDQETAAHRLWIP